LGGKILTFWSQIGDEIRTISYQNHTVVQKFIEIAENREFSKFMELIFLRYLGNTQNFDLWRCFSGDYENWNPNSGY
jgi:hypothetical protein